ncbi:class I SAM-dependent DNA methyltransferase [Maribellus maritimus]|uniref:class I SAM-dependent DNA methyltransferase n=1 Tax=Maribellus maritimus TaxID=2870838 RepID=UPI001EEC84E7|nr:class I SAM-dependent methyltransferase [Maribellus maritimus]MCG6188261.1 class I SAM-dependent methyltransferase [Maribellus maritimus]
MPESNIKLANEFADEYDNSIAKNNWTSPQILFKMIEERLQPKSAILDVGIGTGESSAPFYRAGHSITGVDGSKKMLTKCKSKNITERLTQINLETESLPFSDKFFDLVISNGVFHLISPLNDIFSEISRVLKYRGYFAFTFENANDTSGYDEIAPGIWENKTPTGVFTFKYNTGYISELLQNNGFTEIKQSTFLAFQNKELRKDFYFTAVLSQLE